MMGEMYRLLVINPGSTSTKVSFFQNDTCSSSGTLNHCNGELEYGRSFNDQYVIRKHSIIEYMYEQGISPTELNATVGRGGLLRPLKSGTYLVNERMLNDLRSCRYGKHASNLGAIIAYDIASENGISAYIVDPVVVDEMDPIARYSGHPNMPRVSVFHALNHKAVARRMASDMGKKYEDVNFVTAHLGGGISVAAHKKGRVVDANNALEEGAFSPERTGSLPVRQLIEACYTGGLSKDNLKDLLVGKGGIRAYLGTSDCRSLMDRVLAGDKAVSEVFEAMCYQVSKEIGAYSAVLAGEVDRIGITGGLAHNRTIVDYITERVKFIAPVVAFPGEDEMYAMAEGVMRVLRGEEPALEYD